MPLDNITLTHERPTAPAAHGPDNCTPMHLLEQRVTRLEEALPTNDLGRPDVDGHRQYHQGLMDSRRTMKGYQVEVTKKILAWGVGLLLTVLTTGFWDTLAQHFQGMGQ